ncbi:hypothetical protein scyTo_0013773 [Scyliorhinus torazame]|uniref:Coiled-coil domain-containing protein 146 n=1 Tax=Scyliorhinus torazame TaxID=75743 RepID=A0A401P4K1_SCYTO|nr:hypothetical protein [Scyliorhinus torazame]
MLFSAGKIRGIQIGYLKSKYLLLHEALKRTQVGEIQLLQDAKSFTAEVERQRQELEKADQFPDSSDTEVNKLRQQLLLCQNELNQTEERISQQQHRTIYLQEELSMFKKDFERLPKAALDLVQLHTVPGQLAKDIQKLNRKRNNLEKAKAEIDAQCNELLGLVQQIENKCRMVEDEKMEVMKELDEKRTTLDSKEQDYNQLVKITEMGKENESVLMGERASLDMHLRYIQTEKKILSDTVVVKQRERDRELRKTKKKEKQLKSAMDILAYAEFTYEKIKSLVESVPDGGGLLDRRNELENEVKGLKRKLTDQLALTDVEVTLLRKRMLEEDNLITDQRRAREEVANLTRLAQIRSDEKDQKARDLMNIQQKSDRTVEELKEEKLSLQNSQKKHRQMLISLKSFVKVYQIIKNERNKYVNLIQSAAQVSAEMREKIKILQNEMEILRTTTLLKDRGIHLIEREEEVCIFYEKLNIQDSLNSNGDVELHSMEDEIRFLNIQLTEEKRQIERVRKDVPSKHEMESNLIKLQKELAMYQDKVQSLEKTLVNSLSENRSRLLGGDDPSFDELTKRIDEMELKLARKEEQLLEKDLISDQVTRLSERVNAKAMNGKQDTLALAKKVNEMQGKVKDVTRKMMAVVSELSMQQANAMQLQQDVSDKQQFLELCHQRMEQGMAPSEEFEYEWLKIEYKENRYKQETKLKSKEAEEEEKHLLPGGVFTTAEPRPNAYIPDDDSGLPIPRPYGNMVPFKPSEPSAHMRHYRKPVIKPIEI